MKLLILVLSFTFTIAAHAEDFQSLMTKYQAASEPTETQLKAFIWTYVGIANDPKLLFNQTHIDQFSSSGLENNDDSIMTYEFQNQNAVQFRFTLAKRNFISRGSDRYIGATIEDGSVKHAFSADTSGQKNDLYYVQNCRIDSKSQRQMLICPTTLKLAKDAPNNYSPAINEALDKVVVVQIFTNYSDAK